MEELYLKNILSTLLIQTISRFAECSSSLILCVPAFDLLSRSYVTTRSCAILFKNLRCRFLFSSGELHDSDALDFCLLIAICFCNFSAMHWNCRGYRIWKNDPCREHPSDVSWIRIDLPRFLL